MDQEKFNEILKTIRNTLKQNGIFASNDMALDCATRIYNQEIINNIKTTKPKTNFTPATKKQRDYLKGMSIDFDEKTISKKEASKLIQENKNENP